MKGNLLSIFILISIFFMVGCSNSAEIRSLHDKVDTIVQEVDILKDRVEELQSETKELKKSTEEKENTIEASNLEKANITIKKVYYNDANDLEKLKQGAMDKNKEILIKMGTEGNELLMLETDKEIKDIRLYKLGDEFTNLDFNIEKYLNEYKEYNYVKLSDNLFSNQVLIVKVNESEGIPTDCITWLEPSGKISYHLISYNGKGE